jgi:hypothetical protein
MKYTWDINKWIGLVVGFYYNKPNIKLLLGVLLTPIASLHVRFLAFKSETDFKARYSCQQRAFKSLLNRVFEDARNGKSFYILTTSDVKPSHFAPIASDNSGLANPLYAGLATEPHALPLFFGLSSEYNEPVSFIVFAPIECQSREKEIISWINYYRFVSKNFRIEYI